MKFKDLFSIQASDYAKYRPNYPESLFLYLATLTSDHQKAWDCGTGNGQSAVHLSRYFEQVIATDPSEKQLNHAEQNPKVLYQIGAAEASPLQDRSVSLVTVAQAFHWFKFEEFFKEVKRVSKSDGMIAIWTYNLCSITPELDFEVNRIYSDILGPYWEKERRLVEEGYRKSPFPFQELNPPTFEMNATWDFQHLIGYLSTWSALQTYIKKNGSNPLEESLSSLQKAWGSENTHLVKWPLSVRVGKVH